MRPEEDGWRLTFHFVFEDTTSLVFFLRRGLFAHSHSGGDRIQLICIQGKESLINIIIIIVFVLPSAETNQTWQNENNGRLGVNA